MDNIKDKITKVLEIAKRGGTEEEANTAMNMALQLLAKHNLSMSDIEGDSIEDEDVIQSSSDGGSNQPWQRSIWYAIAKLYFTTFYSSTYMLNGKKKVSLVVVGRESNVQTVKEIASYLVALCKELASGTGEDTRYRNSFKTGFADRIRARCIEERQKAERESTANAARLTFNNNVNAAAEALKNNCNALTLTNIYALRTRESLDFLRAKGIRLTSRTSSWGSRSGDGYGAGCAAGNSVSLRTSARQRIGQ